MEQPSDGGAAVSMASAQGARSHQEDRAVHQWIEFPDLPQARGWLLAVFDGHGGAKTAETAVKAFPGLFMSRVRDHSGAIPEALNAAIGDLVLLTKDDRSGATASIAFIPQDARHAAIAVLGDSPIAALDSHGGLHVGPEHNVRTNLQERAAALARGGVYKNGYLEDVNLPGIGLQMSRSLGDAELSRVLRRDPDIGTVPLAGSGIVLVGTDGLLAPGRTPAGEQIARLLKLIQQGADAQAIVADALMRQTGDNVTALVWVRR